MAGLFDAAPAARRGLFDEAPPATQLQPTATPVAPTTPEEVAQRLGIPGAERLTGNLIESDQPAAMEESLFRLAPMTKQALGTAALATLSPLALLAGPKVAKGVGESLGGLVESATSPAGAAALATAIMRPAEVVPLMMAGGAKQGAKELAKGVAAGDVVETAKGATTLAASIVPLATAALPRARAAVPVEAARPAGRPPLTQLDRLKAEREAVLNEIIADEASATVTAAEAERLNAPELEGQTPFQAASPQSYRQLEELNAKIADIEQGRVPAETQRFLPDLLPHAEAKAVFSQPFGAGQVPVLGRVVDPQARMGSGPLPEALAAYHAERYGVAPAAASNVGLQLRARRVDEAFPVDPATGEFTTVQPTRPGQSLHPSDVLEALQRDPDAYVLTEPQRAAFGELERWRTELQEVERAAGIAPEEAALEGEASYYPRVVIERPETDVAPLGGGGRVGAKQFFQKARLFESEREGVAQGYRYEPSVVARTVTRTERTYRAIADKRLADDPSLGARTRRQVESELREAYAEELGAGTMTETRLQQIVDSVEHKGTVWGQPGFAGKIFDPETANTLNRAFPQADSAFRHRFVQVNNALKAMRLSADIGVGFLQGLPTLFRNPITWSKAVGNSFRALVDPSVLPRYAEANAEAIRQLAVHGSSVGRLPEMLAGLEKGSFVERLPVAGIGFRAAGRQFETFLDVAKVELWKSWREVTPPDQVLPTIRAIESQLSMGRMESIGVSRNRALAERALLLAPSYYRGAVNLVGAIGERGVAGRVARQALTAYAVGGVATFYGLALALGMDESTITERLNPAHPQFLMWEVEVGDRRLNIGFGGIHRSLLRLMANMVTTSIEHPENWKSLTPAKNPLVRWYRGHAAAVPGITWDAITGRDYLGQTSDLTTVGQSVVPLAVQPLIRDEEAGPVDVGASLLGLSAYESKQPTRK